MFPEKFIKRIENQPYIDSGSLLKALGGPSPVSLRVNGSKWKVVPDGASQVPWCDSGWYLPSRPSYTSDPLFHAGCYYPQEASSMFLEQVFRQVAGDLKNLKVLDLCGAPGGKSTHLSSLIGDKGFLVANEVIRSRAVVLAENLTKWGLSNCIVTQSDPSAFSRLPGFFDLMLVDAPCSGEGMFRDRIAVDEWSEDNASLCAERQKRILIDAWPALKEGGVMIYSTCTFNPAENEENIEWLTKSCNAESLKLDIRDFPGIREIECGGITGYGFYPGEIRGDGLFYAAVRKNEAPVKEKSRIKPFSSQRLSPAEKLEAMRCTAFPEESFIRDGDAIVSVPCSISDFNMIYDSVKVIKKGTHVFTAMKNGYIPSHELSMSIGMKEEAYPIIDPGYSTAIKYLRKENFISPGSAKGWNLINYRNISLGFVNNLGTRINNYYPVEWRIRMNSLFQESDVILWQ